MPYAPETHWSIPRRPIARKPHLIYDSQEENQRETLLPFPKPARMSDDLFRTFFMPALFLPHPQNLPDSYSIRQVLNHYIVCSRYAYWLSPFVHFKIRHTLDTLKGTIGVIRLPSQPECHIRPACRLMWFCKALRTWPLLISPEAFAAIALAYRDVHRQSARCTRRLP